MRFRFSLLPALLYLVTAAMPAQAADIDGLLTSLFGGDGVTLASSPIFDHSAHFHGDSLEQLESLSLAALDVSIPLPSGDGGALFVYDPVADDFVETTGNLGTVFAERAETLGAGRWSFGFNYQHIEYSRFEGTDLNDLSVSLNHQPTGGPGPDVCIGGPAPNCHIIELDVVRVDLDLSLDARVLTLFSNYGVTDRWDIGIIVPVMRTHMHVDAVATVEEDPSAVFSPGTIHGFDPTLQDGDAPTDSARADKNGIGDIHIRTKYALVTHERNTLSLTAHARLANGDQSNLQGVGRAGGQLGLLYSGRFDAGPGTLSPHINLLYEVNSGSRGQDEVDLVAGVEWAHSLGRHRYGASLDLVASEDVTHRDGIGDSQLDLALAVRWEAMANSAVYLGLQVPMNRDSGLRADLVSHVGFFWSF